jgi:DNA polymerase elongation subunit (family B)
MKKSIKIEDNLKLFKLYDYNIYDEQDENNENFNKYKDNKKFKIQAFGINSQGNTAAIFINGFNPFFYVKVGDNWNEKIKNAFILELKSNMGRYFEDSIIETKLIKRQKLNIFDNKKLHTFLKLSFTNTIAYNKAKKIFYNETYINGFYEKKLLEEGYLFNNDDEITNCYLYEGDIPPLLKLFHLKEISPSGWISLPKNKFNKNKEKTTNCYFEYTINYDNIVPLKDIEAPVKYKICSFDIEASSSHGDFPLAIKDYKKLATNILENYNQLSDEEKEKYDKNTFKEEILSAFNFNNLNYIDKVYPKNKIEDINLILNLIDNLILYKPGEEKNKKKFEETCESSSDEDDDSNEYKVKKVKRIKNYSKTNSNIIDLIKDNNCEYSTKLYEVTESFNRIKFPSLKGDEITFIGLSFINYTENEPYKRIIIVKGGCKIPDKYLDWVESNNVIVLEKTNEKSLLTTFTKIIFRESPHIITGYNITGFDWPFMYNRSKELDCDEEFLKLSKNKNEVCLSKKWNFEKKTYDKDIETSKIVLASGEYDLKFPKMPGVIIMDMCVILRKEFQLESFKLDFVSSYFISDNIKNVEIKDENTRIYSKNLMGINNGTFIKFEEIGFSNNPYKNGKKFEIININKHEGWFDINSEENLDIKNNKYKWGLAKDDVSPQEIFDLANGDDYDRWTVGKYCLADCDNVIWLLLKLDVITDKVEMSNLCDVPLSFLLLRGQGIKLQSYVSKKCGEKNTLMPTLQKNNKSDGYEGAIVFEPKEGIYLEDPVACVDYSSLYPSSIISENISHDSKVWTKEYDLSDNLINEIGEKDEDGNFKYDKLYHLGYKYVDIKYDTYKYARTSEKSAAKKIIIGYKICRFAQFPEGKAIMPSILEELLAARKSTRKKAALETDPFIKNMLDKRQLSIKVTANSLYGQTGAKTSAFNEDDVAACTTAIGRKLLIYGRTIIEECYNNIVVKVNDGTELLVKAECVYGDTDSVFFKFIIKELKTGKRIINKQALIYTIELAKQAGELASKFLKKPHDLEYEKTFWPWIIMSKKRYVGMLYEEDPEVCKLKFMGIVLKRRDNAPIVKDIYGGIIDILMNKKNIPVSIKFLNDCLNNLLNGNYNIDKLMVTKSLRGYYKNPNQIAHKVLAERIGLRESGNKPGAGDRISYAYFKNDNKKALQGEKIETKEFINQNNLKLDYSHYITNQIMKPIVQIYALELENIPEFKNRQIELKIKKTSKELFWHEELEKLKSKWEDPEKYKKKLEELKCKEVKKNLFDKFISK